MKSDELEKFDATSNADRSAGIESRYAYDADEVDAAIEELKAKLYEAEEAMIEAGADAADYYQENRKLKRALWLARGYIMTLLQRDFQRLAYQCNNDDYKKNLLRRRNRYYDLNEKCRAKAKEYE